MERQSIAIARTATRESAFATNRVLRNTYLLLGATLAFSAVTCGLSYAFALPLPGIWLTLGIYFGLLFAVHKTANSALGLLSVFALTGFLGYTLGPIIAFYVQAIPNGHFMVLTSLALTAVVFFSLSAYAIKSGERFQFLRGFLFIGIITAFLLGLVAVFFSMPYLSLAVSGAFVLLASGLILYQTGEIIHGGETNYILATVTLYVSIYNLFTSLMQLFGAVSGDD